MNGFSFRDANVLHLRQLLTIERNEEKRKMLATLLAEEHKTEVNAGRVNSSEPPKKMEPTPSSAPMRRPTTDEQLKARGFKEAPKSGKILILTTATASKRPHQA
jgi:hypothetical protein